MTKMELLSPPLSVVHTSMGTMAMMEMDVNQPTPAISLTSHGTLGEAYFLSLHVLELREWYHTLMGEAHESHSLHGSALSFTFCLNIPWCRTCSHAVLFASTTDARAPACPNFKCIGEQECGCEAPYRATFRCDYDTKQIFEVLRKFHIAR